MLYRAKYAFYFYFYLPSSSSSLCFFLHITSLYCARQLTVKFSSTYWRHLVPLSSLQYQQQYRQVTAHSNTPFVSHGIFFFKQRFACPALFSSRLSHHHQQMTHHSEKSTSMRNLSPTTPTPQPKLASFTASKKRYYKWLIAWLHQRITLVHAQSPEFQLTREPERAIYTAKRNRKRTKEKRSDWKRGKEKS